MNREDRGTRTVADAAAWEYERARDAGELDDPFADYSPEDDYDDDDPQYDDCRCSDPGCPCTGVKRGGPIR